MTFDIACLLSSELTRQKQYKEAKLINFAAIEGYRKVLGEEDMHTLTALHNFGSLLNDGLQDHEGALDCFQQVLRGEEKVLGKAHPDTLTR